MAFANVRAVVSAKANMSDANVKASRVVLAGRSQNDFICAAKIEKLFEL